MLLFALRFSGLPIVELSNNKTDAPSVRIITFNEAESGGEREGEGEGEGEGQGEEWSGLGL